MRLYEYVGNPHVHTPYSDGTLYHADVAAAAVRAGLDFVITTDHNVWVGGVEGYYGASPGGRVLLLVGEEVHDPRRDPQVNHCLAYGAERELAPYALNPQRLIDETRSSGGFGYLAHPFERAAPAFDEPAIPWIDWNVEGYTGIELWNYMSEFKSLLAGKLAGLHYAFRPEAGIKGPLPETLEHWDRLLVAGRRVRIIGGADAHGQRYRLGPIRRVIFPYEYLFRCLNTHVLTHRPLDGYLEQDKPLILAALRDGHAFVGYDLPAPTRGFRFSAQGATKNVIMGDWIRLEHGVTLQTVAPRPADVRLIHDGRIIAHEASSTHLIHIANRPGAYRVEVRLRYKRRLRGWIFSNPIFVV
jgi:hypothetical protein